MHHKQNRPFAALYSRFKRFQKYIDVVEHEESGQGTDV
jgi:hypothetical protein